MTGETTQITIEVDGVSRVVDLISGASAVQTANTLVGAINQFRDYTSLVNTGSNVRATSVLAQVTDDLVVTVSRAGTGGTAAINRTVVQEGANPTTDFTNTDWTYYIINRGAQTDGDTIDVDDDGTVSVPTGLVVDTDNITASSTTGTAIASMTYLTGAVRSNLVITGGVSEAVVLTQTGTATHSHTLEYSTDNGANWISFFVTQEFDPNFGATFNGQIFNNVQFVGAQINDIPANTTVAFRGRDTGSAATGAWGFGFLVVEERNAEMTT